MSYQDVFGVEYDVNPEGRPRLLIELPENARALGLRKSDPLAKHSSSFEDVKLRGTFTNVKHYHSGGYGGMLHRLDGPAVIEPEFSPAAIRDGACVIETYYLNGSPGRTDGGPNAILRRADGSVYEERYLGRNALDDREDGPARITYREDGSVGRREWKRRGKPSRIDGPSLEIVDPSGQVTPGVGSYALAGKRYATAEGFYRALEDLSTGTLRRHFTGTPLEQVSRGREHEIVRILGKGVRTLEGVEEVLRGSPAEWVAAYEESVR